ncbi:DUF397 domain-containing protein [Streptomyces sp. NBC_01288]|uniref:DUF397 domain-containing protein n=1 Tax=Streptomyces sp. NBC_01288 TaxID=2903814 RepID=UPI002E10B9B6|nr:DUF397 domain-containing protein [Streptomyces sp. NBC_01288]
MTPPPELAWFESSYSDGPEGDSCVEIAVAPRTVHVRDSKHTEGPRLTLTSTAWTGFVHQPLPRTHPQKV